MDLLGKNLIGGAFIGQAENEFFAYNPATGEPLSPPFYEATEEEVNVAVEVADAAFAQYSATPTNQVALFLEVIAANMGNIKDELIERVNAETALGSARLQGEFQRTINQINMFVGVLKEGAWVDARIDLPQAERQPNAKPDLRRVVRPLGPVVVFTASNFPLAFSVAGGDTISALATKNPVIVKTHANHPGTSEMVARAIRSAAEEANMPEGIFSMVHGVNPNVGLLLVRHPLTRAVAITGSLAAGRALFDAAASRPDPIPVFAEMGSINPVFVLPDMLGQKGENVAEELAASITLAAGQFCTNPGLIVLMKGEGNDAFINKLNESVTGTKMGPMLNSSILKGFDNSITQFLEVANVARLATSLPDSDSRLNSPVGSVLKTDAKTFLQNRQLSGEIFGPASLVVLCETVQEMIEVAHSLDGQLTATIQGGPQDMDLARQLVPVLEQRVGRLLWGGVPTGVEVGAAMHHGGPYPATTNSHFTSVGPLAMKRFVRPICYQNFPQELLPVELQNGNYKAIWRLIDNELTRDNCPAYY